MLPEFPRHTPLHEKNFGILNITTADSEPIFSAIRWIFTIDRSASMDDQCPDGKTKMQHIQHTLNNMVAHFIDLGTTSPVAHTLTIVGFDNEVSLICEDELINSELKKKLPALLMKLEPRGMTNIGKAFDYVAGLAGITERTQGSQTVHIFMTDGQITSGERDSTKLLEKLNKSNTSNILIGFGSDHSDKLLRELSYAPKGEYHFVESLENAGMVYGEIIHSRLHECAEDIKIVVMNGEIYDYKTNTWFNKLSVDTLASNQERTWHIRKPWLNGPSQPDCKIRITYEAEQEIRLCRECVPSFPDDGTDKNVERYWWRQRTQELMNDVSNFMENGQPPGSRYVGGNPELPLAPPPSPLVRSHNIENANVVIDAASQEQWEVVWTILDIKPSLIDKRPPARRFNLLHVAAFQGNDDALTNLLERGATASELTEDLLSTKQIAAMNNYHSIVGILTRHETTGSILERIPRLLSRILNEFMASMKMYMQDNNLGDDPFMGNLCDDVYVAIRSLNSRLGAMYLGARVVSQGSQRAYNLTNLTQMDTADDGNAMYPAPPRLHHAMSQNPNSVYASPQTVDTMDALSSPSPPDLQWRMSTDTDIDSWSPPPVPGNGSTATQSDI
jgi:hypothetical protein